MPNSIEIFKAGTRQDANGNTVSISVDDLHTMVKNYNPAFHEAPIVIGHPATDSPAYGWIQSLFVEGDTLKAKPKQVDSLFSQMVKNGKYKKISSAFYLPHSKSNPKPEGYYLRHVGFLGAAPPAVKGLKDPVFNDNATDIIAFNDLTTTNHHQNDQGDNHMSSEQNQNEIFQQCQQKITELESENALLKAEKAKADQKQLEAKNLQFTESLITEGKLIPKLKEQVITLLNTQTNSAQFSENDFKQNLKTFLSQLPIAVEFNEIATKDKAEGYIEDETTEYSEHTDPQSIEVDKAVKSYMKQHSVDYTTAFNLLYH